MGTNYYAYKNTCKCCGRYNIYHLGKSSAGWTFSFRGYEDIKNYDDWLNLVKSADKIEDEYSAEITVDELLDIVNNRGKNAKRHADLYPSKHDWIDIYGNSFSDNEFS